MQTKITEIGGLILLLLIVVVGIILLTKNSTEVSIGANVDVVANIQKDFQIGESLRTFDFTNDNTNEDFIFNLEYEVFVGYLGAHDVHGSLTNASSENQNTTITLSFGEGEHLVSDIRIFSHNKEINIKGGQFPPTATTTGATFPATTRLEPVWTILNMGAFQGKGQERKNVKGHQTRKEATTLIKAGETIVFRATVKYPAGIGGGREFFIEAFGDKGGYGHI